MCCYYLRQKIHLSPSLSLLATSTTPSLQCDEGQMIVSPPALSGYANNPVYQRQLLTDDPPTNISMENGDATCQPKPTHQQARATILRATRSPLNLLLLSGLSTLCQNAYLLEQLINMEWTILEQLDWKLMSLTSVDWCHVLLDVLVVFYGCNYS